MTDGLATAPACEELAARWLDAEERAQAEPANEGLALEARRLGEAYDDAVTAASQEELRLAWEAARERQAREEVGTREWANARRVSELLRTEYGAARAREEAGSAPVTVVDLSSA